MIRNSSIRTKFFISFFVLFFISLALVIYGSNRIRNVNNQYTEALTVALGYLDDAPAHVRNNVLNTKTELNAQTTNAYFILVISGISGGIIGLVIMFVRV